MACALCSTPAAGALASIYLRTPFAPTGSEGHGAQGEAGQKAPFDPIEHRGICNLPVLYLDLWMI